MNKSLDELKAMAADKDGEKKVKRQAMIEK